MKRILPLLTLVILFLSVSPIYAQSVPSVLQKEMAAVANDIFSIMKKKEKFTATVGKFNTSALEKGDVGAVLQLAIGEELEKTGLTITDTNPAFEVTGRYQLFDDTVANRKESIDKSKPAHEQVDPNQATFLLGIKITVQLINLRTGDIEAERPSARLILDNSVLTILKPGNRSGSVVTDQRELNQQIRESYHEPQVEIKNARLQGKTGQYAIEVIVKEKGRYVTREITMEKKLPFLQLDPSEIYGVRLINNSPHEAAVDLRIDGINCFQFSDIKNTYWIIKPHSQLDVLGWHRNESTTTEFKVVDTFADTATAKLHLQPSADFGLIQARFSACWENDNQRPADEPKTETRGSGFGDDIKFNTNKETRYIGLVRDELTIRYER
ncbi:hypothetical protein [Rubinisphaera sp.]|uniref:hypothetical protein n=1 Tax=Rubinisphaera sp. TaxID=2024857 RepID=UPI000C0FB2D8|nr:hypothetical protein [Rubinisphaera sp.]MBV09623.1 hypothetical protein [Rubinisphaera sp.]|tara:strand:+ start:4837 stop:5985 length:1149 start_codon:yes stop_codon:yes gene_type:complete